MQRYQEIAGLPSSQDVLQSAASGLSFAARPSCSPALLIALHLFPGPYIKPLVVQVMFYDGILMPIVDYWALTRFDMSYQLHLGFVELSTLLRSGM